MTRLIVALVLALATLSTSTAEARIFTVTAYQDCRGANAAHIALPLGSLVRITSPARLAGRNYRIVRRAGRPHGSFRTEGRASVFSDGNTASGLHDGISTWFYGRLTGYWRIVAPNGRVSVERQVDNGPARFTGRWLDLLPGATARFGYSFGGFPTDEGTWRGEFLGYRLPAGTRTGVQPPITSFGFCAVRYRERVGFRVIRRGG